MTMNILKKLLIPVAIAAIISLGLAGCDKKGKKPAVEQSAESKASKEHPSKENPSKEEASKEHPSKEHPTKEKASDDHPSNEHPSDNE